MMMHAAELLSVILACAGAIYYALAIVAALQFRRQGGVLDSQQPVSILKPVRGRDIGFYKAIRSHALLHYPGGYELLFGVSDPSDHALVDIERLRTEFPHVPIRVIETANEAPNGKVGSLEILLAHAHHDLVILNDSDILVGPDYLSRVMGLLLQENVGLVTCLYRGHGRSLPARMESLGIATEFAPGVLVAEMLSASDYAFGSTIAMRRSDLESIGGFAAIRNYLADDYQIGARVAKLGKRVLLSEEVVETSMGDGHWGDIWKHQLRWSRTIRVSNPAGYFGFAVAQVTLWSIGAAMGGHWIVAIGAMLFRMAGALASLAALRDWESLRLIWAVPFRDLFGTAIWMAGIAGTTVEWRGIRFHLQRDGTIEPHTLPLPLE